MKNKKLMTMVIAAGVMLLACQKESSVSPVSDGEDNTDAQRYANLKRPSSLNEDGAISYFSYDAEGRLVSKESETEKLYIKRDGMNRISEIDITRRTPYALRNGLEMESKQRILYGYYGTNHYPMKASVLKSFPGRDEFAVQNISFEFDKRGTKLREVIQDMQNNTTTKTDYVYDALNRLTMVTVYNGIEIIKSVKSTRFTRGYGVFTLVKEMSFLPGEAVQAGLPDETVVCDRKTTVTFNYSYEVNGNQQPATIKQWDNTGGTSTTAITYR